MYHDDTVPYLRGIPSLYYQLFQNLTILILPAEFNVWAIVIRMHAVVNVSQLIRIFW